jgi:hypothetical protein
VISQDCQAITSRGHAWRRVQCRTEATLLCCICEDEASPKSDRTTGTVVAVPWSSQAARRKSRLWQARRSLVPVRSVMVSKRSMMPVLVCYRTRSIAAWMEIQYGVVTLFAIRALSGARTRRSGALSMRTSMQRSRTCKKVPLRDPQCYNHFQKFCRSSAGNSGYLAASQFV